VKLLIRIITPVQQVRVPNHPFGMQEIKQYQCEISSENLESIKDRLLEPHDAYPNATKPVVTEGSVEGFDVVLDISLDKDFRSFISGFYPQHIADLLCDLAG